MKHKNTISIPFLLTLAIFLMVSASAKISRGTGQNSDTIGMVEKWPDWKSGTVDIVNGRIFAGVTGRIEVLDASLGLKNTFPLPDDGEITGLSHSPEAPDLLFAAFGKGGVLIIDVSEPDSPDKNRIKAAKKNGGMCASVAYSSGVLFAACGPDGLRMLDVSNPENPVLMEDVILPGALSQVNLVKVRCGGNGRFYAADSMNGVWVLEKAASASVVSCSGLLALPGCVDAAADPADSSRFFALSGTMVVEADASNPADPLKTGELDLSTGEVSETSFPSTMAWGGGNLYVAAGARGIVSVDVSSAGHPAFLTVKETMGGEAHSLSIDGEMLVARIRNDGEEILAGGVSCPADGCQWARRRIPGTFRSLLAANRGNIIFAAFHGEGETSGGLVSIDSSSMFQSSVACFLETPGEPSGLSVSGTTVFLADGPGGLRVIDATDITAMTEKASVATPGPALSIISEGSIVFVACGEAGILSVDVSNPASPVAGNQMDTPGTAGCMALFPAERPEWLYAGDGTGGIRVIRTSGGMLAEKGSVPAAGSVSGVAVSDRYLYALDSGAGIRIFSLDDPASPALAGTVALSASASGRLAISEKRLFAALGSQGFKAFSLEDSTKPVEISGWNYAESPCSDVSIAGSDPVFACVASERQGIRILGLTAAEKEEETGSSYMPQDLPVFRGHGECFIQSSLAGIKMNNSILHSR